MKTEYIEWQIKKKEEKAKKWKNLGIGYFIGLVLFGCFAPFVFIIIKTFKSVLTRENLFLVAFALIITVPFVIFGLKAQGGEKLKKQLQKFR